MTEKAKRKRMPRANILSLRAAVLWVCPFVWLVALAMIVHYVPVLLVLLVSAGLTGVLVSCDVRGRDEEAAGLLLIHLLLSVIPIYAVVIPVDDGAVLLASLAFLLPPASVAVVYALYQWTRFVLRHVETRR